MNNEFRYILEPYKGLNSRIICPSCQRKNQFTRYIDQENNEPLNNSVGLCNRAINCGYHYTPKQYFEDQNILQPNNKTNFNTLPAKQEPKEIRPPSEIPFEILKKTRKAYGQNNFAAYLFEKLGKDAALIVLCLYHIGTSKHWIGATVFWQIDILGKVRAGKVMLYDRETGHRVKKPYPHITWIHKLIELKDYQLNQCLFGEHLVKVYPEKTIAIVESEKTAILAAAYRPEFNWLAAGNLNNLSRERCQTLKGKTVLLFPDAGAFQIWKKKAEDLKDLASFVVSDLIEKYATPQQIKEGFDLADYFEGQPKTMFTGGLEFEQTQEINLSKEIISNENVNQLKNTFETDIEVSEKNIEGLLDQEYIQVFQKPIFWPVEELEKFFSSINIPEESIVISKSLTITNPSTFIKTHLAAVKSNNGKPIFKAYYERLLIIKEILSKKS